MPTVHGEQYAQVDSADPFAPAIWRSPVIVPALPIPPVPDLRALLVGRCEDGGRSRSGCMARIC